MMFKKKESGMDSDCGLLRTAFPKKTAYIKMYVLYACVKIDTILMVCQFCLTYNSELHLAPCNANK
jgi:hypothetical protein